MALVTPSDALARKQRGWRHVDVRPPSEFSRIRVQGSLNIPYDGSFLTRVKSMLKKTDKIVVSCRDGSLSGKAAVRLTAQGYHNIVVVYRGITAWTASGLPVRHSTSH